MTRTFASRTWGGRSLAAYPAPPSPTLDATDKEDGTGAIATISDGNDGAMNQIRVAAWNNLDDGFVTIGTRTGNGAVSLGLSDGLYYAYVLATENEQQAVSHVVAFRVTGDESGISNPHWAICHALQEQIRTLALHGLDPALVLVRKNATRAIGQLGADADAGIIISPIPEQRKPADNERDEVTYRVQMMLFRKANQDVEELIEVELHWRHVIEQQTSEIELPGFPAGFRVQITPGAIWLPQAFAKNYDVGILTFAVYCQWQRGAT